MCVCTEKYSLEALEMGWENVAARYCNSLELSGFSELSGQNATRDAVRSPVSRESVQQQRNYHIHLTDTF